MEGGAYRVVLHRIESLVYACVMEAQVPRACWLGCERLEG